MRSSAPLALLLVAVGLSAGCDTDQPLQTTSGNLSLDFLGVQGQVRKYNTFQVFEDTNLNGQPDDDIDGDGVADFDLFCQTAEVALVDSAPWFFSAKISVIPAGQVEPIQITSGAALSVAANLTQYDTVVQSSSGLPETVDVTHGKGRCRVSSNITCNPDHQDTTCSLYDPSAQNVCERRGFCSANPGIACSVGGTECSGQGRCSGDLSVFCNPASTTACQNAGLGSCITFGTCLGETVTRRFAFVPGTGRKLSGANREVMSAGPNALARACCTEWTNVGVPPALGPVECSGQVVCAGLPPGWAPGVCPGSDLGPPNLDDQPLPFSFQVNKGDTVIVEAGRSGTGPNIEFPNAGNLPVIRVVPRLDGTQLQPGVLVGSTDAVPPEGVLSFYVIAD